MSLGNVRREVLFTLLRQVPNVREVSRGALAVVEELHAYGSAGGSAAGWPAHIYDKLQGKGGPGKRLTVGGTARLE